MSEQKERSNEAQPPEPKDAVSEVTRDPESFGAWLRIQREGRRVDLSTIAQTSKINIRYLELLEEDRFDLLPASVFVRGFLREYARIVGLDADEVLGLYRVASVGGEYGLSPEVVGSSASTWLTEQTRTSASAWSAGRTVAALVGLAAVAAAIIWFGAMDRGAGEDLETMAPPVTGTAPEPPPAEPVPERALRVTMEFQGTSWVDVFVDGDRTVSELRVQGESLTVAADEEVRLKLGSVGATKIEVNDEPFEHGAGDDEEIVILVPEESAAR